MKLNRQQIKEAVYDWQQSGFSISSYCQQHNIKTATFHYWKKKLLTDQTGNKVSSFTKLDIPISIGVIEYTSCSGHRIVFNELVEPGYLKQLMS